MKFNLKKLGIVMVIPALLALGACSEARTDSTQQALRYNGGDFDAETFKNCQSGAELTHGSPGDKIYYYPSAQRTFTFTDAPGAKPESPPLLVSTKSPGQEVTVRGYVTFQLTNDCKTLQSFHERIGKRMNADFPQGAQEDSEDGGWNSFLAQYFGLPINAIMDSVGSRYTWQELYAGSTSSDPNLQVTVQNAVRDQLAAAINGNVGEGVIVVNGVDIQRPEPDAGLLTSLRNAEQARQDGQARITKAEADQKVAEAQNRLAQEQAKADEICRQNYTAEQCTIQKLAQQDQLKNYRPGGTLQVEQKQ